MKTERWSDNYKSSIAEKLILSGDLMTSSHPPSPPQVLLLPSVLAAPRWQTVQQLACRRSPPPRCLLYQIVWEGSSSSRHEGEAPSAGVQWGLLNQSELCYVFICSSGEDHILNNRFNNHSALKKERAPEYHSTTDWCHQLLILSTGKLLITIGKHKKTRKKLLVNNIQVCINYFRKKKKRGEKSF